MSAILMIEVDGVHMRKQNFYAPTNPLYGNIQVSCNSCLCVIATFSSLSFVTFSNAPLPAVIGVCPSRRLGNLPAQQPKPHIDSIRAGGFFGLNPPDPNDGSIYRFSPEHVMIGLRYA